MSLHWYAVYTRPQKEKKVITLLNKKGIENFCPVVNMVDSRQSNRKLVTAPLFQAQIFVHISESEFNTVKSIPWVMNLLYWKSKPAVISDEEIDLVKKLTAGYEEVKLEKSVVNMGAAAKIIDQPAISFNENSVTVKYKTITVNLPSLGYTVTAERQKTSPEAVYGKSQEGLLSSFPRRLNAFFFN